MPRIIILGDGRPVTLATYVRAWKAALTAPANSMFAGSPSDPRTPASREWVLREFRDALDDRINRKLPWYGRGRKWSSEWYWDAWRTARAVNDPRLRVGWVPAEFRARLAERLSD